MGLEILTLLKVGLEPDERLLHPKLDGASRVPHVMDDHADQHAVGFHLLLQHIDLPFQEYTFDKVARLLDVCRRIHFTRVQVPFRLAYLYFLSDDSHLLHDFAQSHRVKSLSRLILKLEILHVGIIILILNT
jgi:hypothetical protein